MKERPILFSAPMVRAILIALAVLGILAGCHGQAETKTAVNASYSVETLFSHDGCKVYRFYDGGYRYFTNCSGSTGGMKSCGKNCTYLDGVAGGKHD